MRQPTDHQEHVNTSFPLSFPVRLKGVGHNTPSFDILATGRIPNQSRSVIISRVDELLTKY